ncbi:MAG TPA: TPM domain-containing protein [Acidimicrobiales bacterium]|nr:TPM domain-containing protein [Acidimicrobiales bacterium]
MGAGSPKLTRRGREEVGRVVAEAESATGLQICVFLGRAGTDSRARAEELFVSAGLVTRPAVLVLVAPREHRVEVVTAPAARTRIPDEAAAAAVEAMTQRFAAGDLAGGIVAGVRRLAEAAGPGEAEPGAGDLPDLLDG